MTIPTSILDIEAAVLASESGLNLAKLEKRFPDIPKRTLQRWLGHLVEAKRIEAHGRGRARLYLQSPVALPTLRPTPNAAVDDDDIPVTAEAAELQRAIRLPLARRTPVGYHFEFLNQYQPNQTEYLPHTLREHLHQLGRSAV